MTELQNLESLRQYNRWIESECLANSFQTKKDRKFDCPTIKTTFKLDQLGNVITINKCPSEYSFIEEMKKIEYPEKMKCRITNEPAKYKDPIEEVAFCIKNSKRKIIYKRVRLIVK